MLTNKLAILIERYLKIVLFSIGFTLTIWRSFDCLQKYNNENLSAKVSMVKPFETYLPSLVLCASSPYNQT